MDGTIDDFKAALRDNQPRGWYPDDAPVLDGVLAGLADPLSFLYGQLDYVSRQTRIATASGVFLDMISAEFFGAKLPRKPGEPDWAFRDKITAELLREKGTREAVRRRLVELTGNEPRIVEPANPLDTGAWSGGGMHVDGRMLVTRRGTCGTYFDKNGLLKKAGPGETRTSWDLAGNYVGVLDEPAATNYQGSSGLMSLHSSTFMIGSNTLDEGLVTAPDGATTARRIASNSATGANVYLSRGAGRPVNLSAGNLAPGQVYTFSAFLRRDAGSTGRSFTFDEWNGSVITRTNGVALASQGVDGDWGRYGRAIRLRPDTISIQVFWVDNLLTGDDCEVWGPQIEAGPEMSSFIYTQPGQPATRDADDCFEAPLPAAYGYNRAGAWGALNLPYQAFVDVERPSDYGISNSQGWHTLGGDYKEPTLFSARTKWATRIDAAGKMVDSPPAGFNSAGAMLYPAELRFKYDPVTLEWLGFLNEPASTNLHPTGNTGVNVAGSTNGLAVGSIDVPALYMAANVNKHTRNTATGDTNCGYMSTTLNAGTYTTSMWLYIPSSSVVTNVTQKIEGASGTGGIADLSIRDAWQRVAWTGNVTVAGAKFTALRIAGDNGAVVYSTCPQVEPGSVATSYIATFGTVQSRDADDLSATVDMIGGFGAGAIQWGSLDMVEGGATDAEIMEAIADVVPAGTVAWTRIS